MAVCWFSLVFLPPPSRVLAVFFPSSRIFFVFQRYLLSILRSVFRVERIDISNQRNSEFPPSPVLVSIFTNLRVDFRASFVRGRCFLVIIESLVIAISMRRDPFPVSRIRKSSICHFHPGIQRVQSNLSRRISRKAHQVNGNQAEFVR